MYFVPKSPALVVALVLLSAACGSESPTPSGTETTKTLWLRLEGEVRSQFDWPLGQLSISVSCTVGSEALGETTTTAGDGTFAVTLSKVVPDRTPFSGRCTLTPDGGTARAIEVVFSSSPGGSVRTGIDFVVDEPSADLTVTLQLVGSGSDPDGVSVRVTGPRSYDQSWDAELGSSIAVGSLPRGQYRVQVSGLALNCESPFVDPFFDINLTAVERVVTVDCIGQVAFHEVVDGLRAIMYLDERGVEKEVLAPGPYALADWSPDGSELLVRDTAACTLLAVDLDGTLRTIVSTQPLIDGRWSPDGTSIAGVVGPGCSGPGPFSTQVFDAQTLQLVYGEPAGDGSGREPVWGPDGRLNWVSGNTVLWEWRRGGGERRVVRTFLDPAGIAARALWAPDGSSVLVYRQDSFRLQLLDGDDGSLLASSPVRVEGAPRYTWTPLGQVVWRGFTIGGWDPATGEVNESANWWAADVHPRAWFPAGRALITNLFPTGHAILVADPFSGEARAVVNRETAVLESPMARPGTDLAGGS